MVSFSLIAVASGLLFASTSLARIDGISAPATVKAGKNFKVTFQTESYITNWEDLAMTVGISTGGPCNGCLGTAAPLKTFNLDSQGHSNAGHGSFTETVVAPSKKGNYAVNAAVMSEFGVQQNVDVRVLSVNITVN